MAHPRPEKVFVAFEGVKKKWRGSSSLESHKKSSRASKKRKEGKRKGSVVSLPLSSGPFLNSSKSTAYDKHSHGLDAAGEQGRGRYGL